MSTRPLENSGVDMRRHAEDRRTIRSELSFRTKGLMINDNGPTHVDSFSHPIPTRPAQTIDQLDLMFTGPPSAGPSTNRAGIDITRRN